MPRRSRPLDRWGAAHKHFGLPLIQTPPDRESVALSVTAALADFREHCGRKWELGGPFRKEEGGWAIRETPEFPGVSVVMRQKIGHAW